jgi:transposase-like protein
VRSWQKYSDEQKQAAVEHYLSHDRCMTGTIKALGYPCRDTFAAWIDGLHPKMRIHVVGKVGVVQHSPEFKRTAILELCNRQISAQKITQKLAVSRPTLYKWKNQLLGREVPTSMKLHNDSQPDPERLNLEQQVEALQRDIRKLQLEHDLLKKANELLKKGLGVHLPLLSNREKTVLVDALRKRMRCRSSSANLTFPAAPTSIIEHSCWALISIRGRAWPSQKSSNAITAAMGTFGYGRHWAGSTSSFRRKSCSV